jgi:hypothetical protein
VGYHCSVGQTKFEKAISYTYRYEDTKPAALQLPLVKFVKPAVKRMMTHITNAAGVPHSVASVSR